MYGFTAWAGPEFNPVAKMMNETITEFSDASIKLPGSPGHYLFSDKQFSRGILIESGFDASSIQFQRREIFWDVPYADFYFDTEMKAGVRNAMLLKQQSPEALQKIRTAISEKMEQFYTGETYRLKFCGCVISAAKA
jgi:hypothetical protein